MSENNEYYAEKLRRLLEKRKAKETETAGGLNSGKKAKLSTPLQDKTDEPASEEKDFAFDPDRPKHQQEEARETEEKTEQAEAPQPKRKLKRFAVTAALVLAIIVLGAFCVYKLFFVIHDISVEGNSKYSSEQILAAVGAEKGDNLYSFSSKVAAESIRMYCPEVGEVVVKRTPPGRIVVTVVEDSAAYYAEVYGEIRTFTKDLRVLGVITSDKCEGLIKLKLPDVQRAVAGEQVRFIDNQGEYVYEAARAVAESELYTRLGTLDLSSAHDIRLTCDGKYILKMGSSQNAADKLKIAAAVLRDDMFKNNNKATIDLTNMAETGVIIDNQLVVD